MKSEMRNQLLRDRATWWCSRGSWEPGLGMWVWLNSSIDMIQVQGFQYDPVYYQLDWSRCPLESSRDSHIHLASIFYLVQETPRSTMEHHGAPGNSRVLHCPWLSPIRWTFLPLNNTSHPSPSLTKKDKWEASMEIISRYNYSFAWALPSSQH